MKRKRSRTRPRNSYGQVFSRGEIDEQLRNLKRSRDPELRDASRRASSEFKAIQRDRTAIWLEITGDHVDESCLACAIGADQANLLPSRDVDRQAIRGNHGAESLFELAYRKQRRHDRASFLAISGISAGATFWRPFRPHSEPMPSGKSRITASRKTPSTSCQVFGM